ncbi:MAG TPA: T9SS type A sorting domain-containing protein, partial [Puia sp.]|nr:T9SS type A sorting domain-containing protein [Puia sp.]
DPGLGTLTEVKINSVVSVNYGFSLTNINSSPIDFSVAVGRKDNFQSAVLSTPYTNTINASIGTFYLDPNQTVTQAPSTIINRYDNSIDISGSGNLVDFIGNGIIQFDYAPRTYANNSGSSTYQYSATANDTIHFSITYSYCNNIVLATDITQFFASKVNPDVVQLSWNTSHDLQGRSYELQWSKDGTYFNSIETLSSSGTGNEKEYQYRYTVNQDQRSLLCFRLKIREASGVVGYSELKWVDMKESFSSGFVLFPNPSDQFINIIFDASSFWQVDIINSNGMIVQHNEFNQSNSAKILFTHPLAQGVYFARIIDKISHKKYVTAFVVK